MQNININSFFKIISKNIKSNIKLIIYVVLFFIVSIIIYQIYIFQNNKKILELSILYDQAKSNIDSVEFDKNIRVTPKLDDKLYLHKSRKPLDEVDFRSLEDMGQINMFEEECSGLCGV